MTKLREHGQETQRVRVSPVPGVEQTAARALAFLVIEGDERIDCQGVLRRLYQRQHKAVREERKMLWARFDHWLAGFAMEKYHHGWPKKSRFPDGYVFRWDFPSGVHRRLYGFLASPRPRLEVCVLCCFRLKNQQRTEEEVIRTVMEVSQDGAVKAVIKARFSRPQDGTRSWTH